MILSTRPIAPARHSSRTQFGGALRELATVVDVSFLALWDHGSIAIPAAKQAAEQMVVLSRLLAALAFTDLCHLLEQAC